MVDRRIILAAVVLIGMFIAVSLDPLNIGRNFASESGENASTATGLFTGANLYATLLPGVFFLLLITFFYMFSKDSTKKD